MISKKIFRSLALTIPFIIILGNLSFTSKDVATPGEKMKLFYLDGITGLKNSFLSLHKKVSEINDNEHTILEARTAFLQCRDHYKQIEFLIEYYNPNSAEQLNGPLILKVADDDGEVQTTIHPEGFQVIEDVLWSEHPEEQKQFLISEMNRYKGYLNRLEGTTKIMSSQDFQVFDAMRLELIRIFAIGLTGFDSPAATNSLEEARTAFASVKSGISFFKPNAKGKAKKIIQKIETQIDHSAVLFTQTDFALFDRMKFIREYINPVYADLVELEKALNITSSPFASAIYAGSKNIFDEHSWNPYFYSPDRRAGYHKGRADLGKMLFFDPVLSGNNERSCASCHNPRLAFTDGVPKSLAFDPGSNVLRNAPTLINAAFQANLFLDSRIQFFEFQVTQVNQNVTEMHGNFSDNINKLNQSEEYKLMFKKAFKNTSDTNISTQGIMSAIAAYERTLIGLNSRFDRYMSGDKHALNTSEINGFNIFMGKAQCGTCHFAPLFNGTVPPAFEETEFENLGVPKTKENKEPDDDAGRYNVSGMNIHKYFFKTPTVRNIELTAPYMHNGVFNTLEEVLDFYNKGGGAGHGYEVPNQTLPAEPLNLSEQEMTDVIAFMKSLTDTVGLTSRPTRLPSFDKNEVLNSRKIGGTY